MCLLFLITPICFSGCINDNTFYDDSSKESEEKGLLLSNYSPSQNTVRIANNDYKIADAWTAYKYKRLGSDEIHKELIAFTIVLEDSLKNREPESELMHHIRCSNKGVLFNGVGISDSQYRVFFNKESLQSLDTLKFEFWDGNTFRNVNFIRE